jgi:threonine synthase
MSYQQRTVFVITPFLEDFTASEIGSFATKAYNSESFDTPEIAPVRAIEPNTFFLELWHGPTSAFKDMALQMLPHFLITSLKKKLEKKNVCILVATSGDTGKAALEGFRDVDRTKIMVFYPRDGVSDIQKLQMVTQEGQNVGVCAVEGNFDDAQSGVKAIFSDADLRERLESKGFFLSSANSINWGRLLPQIVYYVSAYCDLVKEGRIFLGEQVHVCVPTGNFGNILAAYYAKKMGVPIGKLICASNSNNVLTDFISTGTYDKNRKFYTTISPSMDILISSNLERLLYDLSGHDDELVSWYMKKLAETGVYSVNPAIKSKLETYFWANYCDDEKTKLVIRAVFGKYNYLIDPHTAVAYDVLNHYRYKTGDTTPAIVASTASPYKFCDSVLDALGEDTRLSGLELIGRLSEVTGTTPPKPLLELKNKPVRFDKSVKKEYMINVVEDMLLK